MKFTPLFSTLFFVTSLCATLPVHWQQHDSFVRAGIRRSNQWYDVSEKHLSQRFGRHADSIGRLCMYRPTHCNYGAKPVVFFLIHGTWARAAYDFEDDKNRYFQMSRQCAADLATRSRVPVEFVSFRWPGGDTFHDRSTGGRVLSQVLMEKYGPKNDYHGTHFLAHSHGCNVVSLALHNVSFIVDTLFFMAPPVVEATECGYRPTQFRRLYSFHSPIDPVQFLGSLNRQSSKKFFAEAQSRIYQQQEGRRVINIRTKIDGCDPGHIRIKAIIPHLWAISDQLNRHYRYHHDFMVDVTNRVRRKRLHHTRPLLVIEAKIKKMAALHHVAQTPNAARVAQMILEEFDYSTYQEEQYAAAYRGRSIRAESSWLHMLAENFKELQIILSELFSSSAKSKD
ncbi:MAG: hypothetical protein PVJ92_01870 [Candidatus Dependentiae bacterium]|jgi:hypothetical protein